MNNVFCIVKVINILHGETTERRKQLFEQLFKFFLVLGRHNGALDEF